MMLRAILLIIFGTAFLFVGMTGPQGLKIGDKASDFSLTDVNGEMISLDSYKGAKGYMVVFTCNNCPYAKAYQQRIADLQNDYGKKGIPVIAINTSDSKEDIIARAKEQSYPFPYLHDESQEVSRSYGATKTPHFYVLRADRTVAYIGAIDNNYKDAAKANKHYVKDAVEAVLANKPVKVSTTKAIGCTIKWKDS